ncbi:hypothetical protein CWB99_15845 [Pseudoalteromonas rubra]|uniref:Uncharacterized protein n=1 Tax=Pseudoalteromonas rubra TaxID=43658 RepID=A0A5S3WIU5_9GAMM|nr:hypothetical protein CWB99_15845 [Pseudoalteromonas rubra]TMP29485.1 hypothetical protein CWC00_18940 [Pseudoalteromonas rubra]
MGKNWEWSYKQGRYRCLKAETEARSNNTPFDSNIVPLHSYDGTMQSKFSKGWHSVSEVDIRRHMRSENTYQAVSLRLAQQFGAANGHS